MATLSKILDRFGDLTMFVGAACLAPSLLTGLAGWIDGFLILVITAGSLFLIGTASWFISGALEGWENATKGTDGWDGTKDSDG